MFRFYIDLIIGTICKIGLEIYTWFGRARNSRDHSLIVSHRNQQVCVVILNKT